METVFLNGQDLTPETLKSLQSFESKIDLSESAWEAVKNARKVIDKVLDEKRTVYGINTGLARFFENNIYFLQVLESSAESLSSQNGSLSFKTI